MQLNDILTTDFTDEEFLSHQRELHRERCLDHVARIMKKANDTAYIEDEKKAASYAMKNSITEAEFDALLN